MNLKYILSCKSKNIFKLSKALIKQLISIKLNSDPLISHGKFHLTSRYGIFFLQISYFFGCKLISLVQNKNCFINRS